MSQRKTLSLLQWGLICILGGVVSFLIMGSLAPNGDRRTAADRGAALGRAAASLTFVVAGFGLIGYHFIRNAQQRNEYDESDED